MSFLNFLKHSKAALAKAIGGHSRPAVSTPASAAVDAQHPPTCMTAANTSAVSHQAGRAWFFNLPLEVRRRIADGAADPDARAATLLQIHRVVRHRLGRGVPHGATHNFLVRVPLWHTLPGAKAAALLEQCVTGHERDRPIGLYRQVHRVTQ